jgi:hypothetical protein
MTLGNVLASGVDHLLASCDPIEECAMKGRGRDQREEVRDFLCKIIARAEEESPEMPLEMTE